MPLYKDLVHAVAGKTNQLEAFIFIYARECEKYGALCGDIFLLLHSSMSACGPLYNRGQRRHCLDTGYQCCVVHLESMSVGKKIREICYHGIRSVAFCAIICSPTSVILPRNVCWDVRFNAMQIILLRAPQPQLHLCAREQSRTNGIFVDVDVLWSRPRPGV